MNLPMLLQYEAARESISEVYAWQPWCHPDYTMEDSSAWVSTRKVERGEDRAYSFVIFTATLGDLWAAWGLIK